MKVGDVRLASRGKDLVLTISGILDERLKLRELRETLGAQEGKAERLLIDLAGVSQVNSVGVRDWLLFFTQAQQRFKCEFTRVSEAIVLQAAILPAILGEPGTPIGQFEVPYYCGKCRIRVELMLKREDVASAGGFVPPPRSCDQCGGAMEFDAMEQDYLLFLAR